MADTNVVKGKVIGEGSVNAVWSDIEKALIKIGENWVELPECWAKFKPTYEDEKWYKYEFDFNLAGNNAWFVTPTGAEDRSMRTGRSWERAISWQQAIYLMENTPNQTFYLKQGTYHTNGGYNVIDGKFYKINVSGFDMYDNLERPYIQDSILYKDNLFPKCHAVTAPWINNSYTILKDGLGPSYQADDQFLGNNYHSPAIKPKNNTTIIGGFVGSDDDPFATSEDKFGDPSTRTIICDLYTHSLLGFDGFSDIDMGWNIFCVMPSNGAYKFHLENVDFVNRGFYYQLNTEDNSLTERRAHRQLGTNAVAAYVPTFPPGSTVDNYWSNYISYWDKPLEITVKNCVGFRIKAAIPSIQEITAAGLTAQRNRFELLDSVFSGNGITVVNSQWVGHHGANANSVFRIPDASARVSLDSEAQQTHTLNAVVVMSNCVGLRYMYHGADSTSSTSLYSGIGLERNTYLGTHVSEFLSHPVVLIPTRSYFKAIDRNSTGDGADYVIPDGYADVASNKLDTYIIGNTFVVGLGEDFYTQCAKSATYANLLFCKDIGLYGGHMLAPYSYPLITGLAPNTSSDTNYNGLTTYGFVQLYRSRYGTNGASAYYGSDAAMYNAIRQPVCLDNLILYAKQFSVPEGDTYDWSFVDKLYIDADYSNKYCYDLLDTSACLYCVVSTNKHQESAVPVADLTGAEVAASSRAATGLGITTLDDASFGIDNPLWQLHNSYLLMTGANPTGTMAQLKTILTPPTTSNLILTNGVHTPGTIVSSEDNVVMPLRDIAGNARVLGRVTIGAFEAQ